MKYALVFPGQGGQKAGMGKELYDSFSSAHDVFDEVDDSLNYHLSRVIFNGPEEELRKTAITQPAILTVSIAVLRALQKEMGMADSLSPIMTAGHSLGEYTALIAGGALSLREGAELVHLRGKWMQEAVPEGRGAMAAIMGMDANTIKQTCLEAAPNGECQAANFNSPSQIVISGETEFVNKAIDLAKKRGAKKAVMLNVSAPFHSQLMRHVARQLSAQFEKYTWSEPKWPIVSNAFAQPMKKVDDILKALFEQTYSPVLWEDSVLTMTNAAINTFLELGPGNVLSGLIKRCQKGLKCISASTPEELEALVKWLNEPHDEQTGDRHE